MRLNHAGSNTECAPCDDALNMRNDIEIHSQAYHNGYPSECQQSDGVIPGSLQVCEVQVQQAPKDWLLSCTICGLVFHDMRIFSGHMLDHHDNAWTTIAREEVHCRECDLAFQCMVTLNRHMAEY